MKKIVGITLFALAALAGCRNVQQESPSAERTVRFRAASADTRTAFDEAEGGLYQTRWTAHDTGVLLSLNYAEARTSGVTASADGKTASFEASFDASAASTPYTFYALSPASAARAISPSRKAWSVYIAAQQTPTLQSPDEDAQLLVAKSASAAVLPDEVDLHFSHLTAYGRMTLKNLPDPDARVQGAELVFETPVVGEWYWGEDGSLTANGASHTITLTVSDPGDLWFACAPVSVGGTRMTLTVLTDQGTLTKEITFPEGRSFAAGKVARFSVDLSGLAFQKGEIFELVQDVSTLKAGDRILIVNTEGTYALGGQANSSIPHRRQAEVTVEDEMIKNPGAASVLTLGSGTVSGTWSLHTGSGYLSAASSGDVLQESSSKDASSSWKISVSRGSATVQAQGGGSRYIRYRASSSRFSCYSSASDYGGIVIYRSSGQVDLDDPVTAFSAFGSYLSGAERTYVRGTDQILRSYDGDGKLVFSLLNAAQKEQLVVSGYDPSLVKGDPVTVTVSWRRGKDRLFPEQTISLQVVREDGSRVWLGDGSGQGIILKK